MNTTIDNENDSLPEDIDFSKSEIAISECERKLRLGKMWPHQAARKIYEAAIDDGYDIPDAVRLAELYTSQVFLSEDVMGKVFERLQITPVYAVVSLESTRRVGIDYPRRWTDSSLTVRCREGDATTRHSDYRESPVQALQRLASEIAAASSL